MTQQHYDAIALGSGRTQRLQPYRLEDVYMSRVRLSIPEQLPFATSIGVRVTDLNYGGHLAHQQVLVYCQEARVAFLDSLGYSEIDCEGLGLIMADAVIRYRAEAFAGDQIEVALGIAALHRKGFDCVHRLTRVEDQVEVALVKTALIFFDYASRSTQAIPATVAEKFHRYVIQLPYA